MASVVATVDLRSEPTMASLSDSTSSAEVQSVKPVILGKNIAVTAAAAAVAATATADHDPKTAPVRQLTLADLPRAVNSLCAAFADDAVARYFTHGLADTAGWSEARRWRLHMAIMKSLIKAHMMRGYAVGIGAARPSAGPGSQRACFVPADPANPSAAEAFDAVALFMPPGADMDGLAIALRSGLWRLRLQLSREGRRRFFGEFFPLLHDTKLRALGSAEADAAAWYLVYVGTRAGARGKGCAGRLIRSVTEDVCDVEGRECYLESSNTVNVKIYNKLGFEYVETIALNRDIDGGPVEMQIMVRKPRSSNGKHNDEDEEAKRQAGVITP